MAWGALAASVGVGAVQGILGARAADAASRRQSRYQNKMLDLSYEQMEQQNYWNEVNFNQYLKEMRRQESNDQYARDRNALMDRRYDDERAYYLEQQEKAERNAERDREYMLRRQLDADSLAMEDRNIALQNMRENRNIALQRIEEERQMMDEAKAQQQAERQWQLDRIAKMDTLADRNRVDQLDQRGNYLNELTRASSVFEDTMSRLGVLSTPEFLGNDFIEGEYERLSNDYTANVDRAVDRIASVNEADLISRGIDRSGTADFKRAEIAQRVAPMYQDALNRARQDAINSANARNQVIGTQHNADLQMRDRAMQEAQAQYQNLNFMRGAPQVGSGMETMGMAPSSAVYTDRAMQQLPTYQGLPTGMSNTMPVGYYQPQNYSAPTQGGTMTMAAANPNAYMGNINPVTSGALMNQYGNMSNFYGNMAQGGAAAFAGGINTIGQGLINYFNTPSQPSGYPMAMNTTNGYGGYVA